MWESLNRYTTGRPRERLRDLAQVRLAQRLGFAQIGFVQFAMNLAIGHPIPLTTLLAFFAGREYAHWVGEVKRAVSIVGQPGVPCRGADRKGFCSVRLVKRPCRHGWRSPRHSNPPRTPKMTVRTQRSTAGMSRRTAIRSG